MPDPPAAPGWAENVKIENPDRIINITANTTASFLALRTLNRNLLSRVPCTPIWTWNIYMSINAFLPDVEKNNKKKKKEGL
jgi:hypothetical protein